MKKPYRLWKRENGVFYYSANGKNWKTTGEKTKAAAIAVAINSIGKNPDIKPISLGDFLAPYFTEDCPHSTKLASEGRPSTLRHIKAQRYLFEKYVFPDIISDIPILMLKKGDFIDMRSRLLKITGPRTVNKIFTAIRTALNEGVFRGDIPEDPTKGIKLVKYEKKRTIIISPEKLREMFPENSLGPWNNRLEKCCFYLAATTGMRRGEVLALRWSSIDFSKKVVWISEAFKDDQDTIGLPKWNKKRFTPIPKLVLDELQMLKVMSKNDLVFCNDSGKRLSNSWWRDSFNRALSRIGIGKSPGLSPHSLRHTLNTILRSQGLEDSKIRKALGWGSEIIQDNYTHFQPEHLEIQGKLVGKIFE